MGWSKAAILACALVAPNAIRAEDARNACEIHVWGAGTPNRVARMLFFQDIRDREAREPLSPDNVYGTVYRANMLSEPIIRRLLPDGWTGRIVRHVTMVDLDVVKLSNLRRPIESPARDCHADLVLTGIDGYFPNPDRNPRGLVGELIAGGNRLVSRFWLQIRLESKMPFKMVRGSFDSPLALTSAEGRSDREPLAVAAASDDNLGQFVQKVRKLTLAAR